MVGAKFSRVRKLACSFLACGSTAAGAFVNPFASYCQGYAHRCAVGREAVWKPYCTYNHLKMIEVVTSFPHPAAAISVVFEDDNSDIFGWKAVIIPARGA